MNTLYIAWQDPQTRYWHTVGRLSRNDSGYHYAYTCGALASERFTYLGRMNDLHATYHSDSLFPLFSNRLLEPSRPEYPEYLGWMGIGNQTDKLELLARSGGYRGTDRLCVYPDVQSGSDGSAEFFFFSHGLRHLERQELDAIHQLQSGRRLTLIQDSKNIHDNHALLIIDGQKVRVGYCPRYLSQSLHDHVRNDLIEVRVEKLNLDAPLHFRLLCKASLQLGAGCSLYFSEEHKLS